MYQIEDLIKEIRDTREELTRVENTIAHLKQNPVTTYIIGHNFTNVAVEGKLISRHLEDLLTKVKEYYTARRTALIEHKNMLDKITQSVIVDINKTKNANDPVFKTGLN